jgi:hypothetical protein
MDEVIKWLLDSEPWVEYRTRLDLLGEMENDQNVINAKKGIIIHPKINAIFNDLYNWNEQVVNSHKNAGLPLHKLSFIADIGLSINDPEIKKITDIVMEHHDDNGVLQVIMNIPKHFGGTGENSWGWMLCDAPIILYSLHKLGVSDNLLGAGIRYLVSLIKDNGWACTVSQEMGKFRGPGRKDDPCPYASLVMLKLLSQFEDYKNGNECRIGAECLLGLWEKSMETHPYLFYMGNDFRKLKAPTMWYDIVSVTDVLSQFEWLRSDPRLNEMVNIIKSKKGEDGCFTPESEYKACKGWDFGQKKNPSQWLTFLILRIFKRMGSEV